MQDLQPMRIACIIHEYHPFGGLQRDMRGIVERLVERGHHVQIFAMHWQGDAIDGAARELYPARGLSHPGRQQRFYAQLRTRLASAAFDCVIGFNRMPGLDVLFNGDDCFAWKMQQRSLLQRWLPRSRHYMAMERAVWGAAANTLLLLVSARQQQQYLSCYPQAAERAQLLPPGVTHPRASEATRALQRAQLRPLLGTGTEECVLVFVASDFHTKGLDIALKALAQQDTPLRLWVVGGDDARPYQRLAQQLGMAHRVDFLGARDDVAQLMQAADALLHPARAEAAGLVLVEALQAGLAVITSAVCGHAAHIHTAQAGMVIEANAMESQLPRAFAALADAAQRASWQRNALQYAQQEPLGGLHERAVALIEQWAGAQPA